MDGRAISFGPFRLVAAQRLLLEGDKPVRLGSRAFDILAALVERAGEVVGKKELLTRAWPQTFVEEANLKFQVSALRRALGDGQGGHRYVVTVPGRGYNFVAPINLEEPPQVPLPPTIAPAAVHNLPVAATRMIGRDEAVAAIVSQLSRERLVTIVGPGGIGKTTVALAVAERMIAEYEHGVWLVDLAPLGDPRLVPSAVATVLGLEVRTEDPLPGLVARLRGKRMLLLLDNCVHIIDAAASLAEAVLSGAPGVNILATSREPLRVAGEREYRLGPLGSPQTSSGLTVAEAAAFPAVQLFVERVTTIVEDFALTDANAPLIGEICRRLDGLPLAIEFAAARVPVFGVEGLAAGLDDTLPLLGARRRTAAPRHRTMRAVLDWSYGLLSEDEQLFFRALGIFAGGFTVEAVAAVAMEAAKTRVDAIDRLADLVAKSLVVADCGSAETRFRLLQTTRAYALEKLAESGKAERIAQRHAEFFRDFVALTAPKSALEPLSDKLALCSRELDNVRAALDWAFSRVGDTEIGVALTAAYTTVWLHMTLMFECRERVQRALASPYPESDPSMRFGMQLHIALAVTLLHTGGMAEKATESLTTALEIAGQLDSLVSQMYAHWVMWVCQIYKGDFLAAQRTAQSFSELAIRSRAPENGILADRLLGTTMHYVGEQTKARYHLERVLDHNRRASDDSPAIIRRLHSPSLKSSNEREGYFAAGLASLARVLCLQGFVDKARASAQGILHGAQDAGHVLMVSYALAEAVCPVAFMIDDLETAERSLEMLVDLATSHDTTVWKILGRCLVGKLLIKRGEFERGSVLLRAALDTCDRTGWMMGFPEFLGAFAQGLAGLGQYTEALTTVEQALVRADSDGERWYLSELLRTKGELLLQEAGDGCSLAAEDCFNRAREVARRQGALLWELQSALSFARLRVGQNRQDDAVQILAPVYDRFVEGFDTAVLRSAKVMLEALPSHR